MSIEESNEYYIRRRSASLAMSQSASEIGIQRIHLELARRYADLAGSSHESIEPLMTLSDIQEQS